MGRFNFWNWPKVIFSEPSPVKKNQCSTRAMFFDEKLCITDYKVIKLVFIGDLSTVSDHGSKRKF